MSTKTKRNYQDLEAELLLERKENYPKLKTVSKGTILANNSRGLYLDIGKNYEGYVSPKELGDKPQAEYKVGETIDIFVASEDKSQAGIFKLSIRQIEEESKWQELENFGDQNLEVTIRKVLKSGLEAEIVSTKQIGFIPFAYLDMREEALKSKENRDQWVGISIPARIHELDRSKNKIILNHKVIAAEHREAKALEVLSTISIGQIIKGTIVRTADFGVFVDIGGLDALIPSSELSWQRFKKPSDIINVGDIIEAKVFKVEPEGKRVALSVKQAQANPWLTLKEEIKAGYQGKAKVVTHAEFGAFVEIEPGVEALLHKSNFPKTGAPEIGTEIDVEIINFEPNKKRMGVKFVASDKPASTEPETNSTTETTTTPDNLTETDQNQNVNESQGEKEPEHV